MLEDEITHQKLKNNPTTFIQNSVNEFENKLKLLGLISKDQYNKIISHNAISSPTF